MVATTPSRHILPGLSRFAQFAWAVLAYNILVVLWGAFVRATGSGAGCGAHWPLCNGEIIPIAPSTARLIEFSHRVTSGLTLVLVLGLVVWAYRSVPRGSIVRLGAGASVFFTITEAIVGAGLVLFQLVAENASWMRALSVAVHLTNTFFLIAVLTLTAYWASGGKPLLVRQQGKLNWFLGIGLLGVLSLGVTGAITALGDTLFPVSSVTLGFQQDFSSTAQFLIRLRVIHPLLAITVGTYAILLVRVVGSRRPSRSVQMVGTATTALVVTQWIAGIVNIFLLAPVWMQLVHLLLADLVWIGLVLFSALVVSEQGSSTRSDLQVIVSEQS